MCEIESDNTLMRTRVARVLRDHLGVKPEHLGLETLNMVSRRRRRVQVLLKMAQSSAV